VDQQKRQLFPDPRHPSVFYLAGRWPCIANPRVAAALVRHISFPDRKSPDPGAPASQTPIGMPNLMVNVPAPAEVR
jgi:hypothetical protein